MKITDSILHFISRIDHYIQITENGHPEHFIVGSLIGGFISFFILKITNDTLKALFFGIGASILVGVLKEVIDPLIGGSRDKTDILFTVLGGIAGTAFALLFHKRAAKKALKAS